jgi:excisionase family DNA binding protein
VITAERQPITADPEERRQLKRVEQAIGQRSDAAKLVGIDGTPIEIPEPLYAVLVEAVKALRQGKAVTIVPTSHELTTQQAADFLNVSRPHLIKLLERSEIPHEMVGTHRRIRFEDLVAYRHERTKLRRKVIGDLTAEAQELGLYAE